MKLRHRLELSCLKAMAMEACIDVYNDYDESEIYKLSASVQLAWMTGKSLVENSLKQTGE